MRILFLCTGNSCRSQMAEAWARKLKADEFEVYSAGIAPKGIDPRAVKVMEEAGLDMTSHVSKSVADLKNLEFDLVITLCGHAHETCPVFPGKTRVVHHGFEDPPKLAENAAGEEEALEHYRRVRDLIKEFVESLPESVNEKDERRTFKLV